ncbi:Fic family protein [Pseudonocardia sp. N23]|uniref:Fic/DOC family protein n=1 Tax=Pseudonocardia sp. N23 TaxID=1987376 RepID=UPI000BFD7EF4|nr:Fic family protein [Pseudonocardia sp. N23]GAY10757.1 cell filamentation protein [Pseudonocardia sp. N23]
MAAWDPCLDLGSGVLRNRLGITDPALLSQAEADLATNALAELSRTPLPGRYDLAHLQAVHRFVFGDIYPWAGELRTVTLGRNGQMFCAPGDITPRAGRVFLALSARDHLRGLGRESFLDELTELLAALTHLHPFREGNGRAQRALLGQLARDAGYKLDWALLDADENTAASRAANDGDPKPLRVVLDRLTTSPS